MWICRDFNTSRWRTGCCRRSLRPGGWRSAISRPASTVERKGDAVAGDYCRSRGRGDPAGRAGGRRAGRSGGGRGGGRRWLDPGDRQSVLPGRSARWHQVVHLRRPRFYGQRRLDRGPPADLRCRLCAGLAAFCLRPSGPATAIEAVVDPACGAKCFADLAARQINTRKPDLAALAAVASRTHGAAEAEALLLRWNVRERRNIGSSLKFCLVARGEADIYPRIGSIHEWDTAAGDAVLRAAGGIVTLLDGSELTYGKTR